MDIAGRLSVPQYTSSSSSSSIPPPHNSSTILFADGTKENLDKLVVRCKQEDTAVFGAMAAAVMVGYAVVTGSSEAAPLKMRIYVNINMRERVLVPIKPETIGCYASVAPLENLSKEQIDVTTKRFWDLARAAKRETTENAHKFVRLALPTVLLDQHLASQTGPAFFEGVAMSYTSVGDAIISSIGRYPHKTTHLFRAAEDTEVGEMSVESVHYNSRTPFLAPSTQFYITSVHRMNYGYSHHYSEDVGKTLFEAVVAIMEHSGSISSNDTLADVIRQVPQSNLKPGGRED